MTTEYECRCNARGNEPHEMGSPGCAYHEPGLVDGTDGFRLRDGTMLADRLELHESGQAAIAVDGEQAAIPGLRSDAEIPAPAEPSLADEELERQEQRRQEIRDLYDRDHPRREEAPAERLGPDAPAPPPSARLTYRERRARRADRLDGFAEKRQADAGAVLKSHERFRGDHAFNFQPGHIPLRAKVIAQAERAFESLDKAESMSSRAAGIRAQDRAAIYRDDPDELERLESKLAKLERTRERFKEENRLFRKEHRDELRKMGAYDRGRAVPHESYELSNLSGRITTTRKRIEEAKARRAALAGEGSRGFGRQMQARFAGDCAECGHGIAKDDPIRYYRLTKEALHEECAETAERVERAAGEEEA